MRPSSRPHRISVTHGLSQRVVLLDADMLVKRNMDELMELELPEHSIAAVHVCACNPFKLPHYPDDW